MPPITAESIKIKPRAIGRFVVVVDTVPFVPRQWMATYWVEKITAHTEHGAEVRSRWCEAMSERKAHLIATAMNNLTHAPIGEPNANDD